MAEQEEPENMRLITQSPPPQTAPALIDGIRSELTLSPDGSLLQWTTDGGAVRCLSMEKEVLGVGVEEAGRIRIKALVTGDDRAGVCCWSCFGLGAEEQGEMIRIRKDFVADFLLKDCDQTATDWAERIIGFIDSLGRPKKLFVILNPFGGRRCGQRIFANEIKPLLDAASVCYTLQETEHQLHAQELAYNLDLFKYDGVVCVSGDGVLAEVLNGLLRREDWSSAIEMPLGIIPAGTGNGMVKSLLHSVGYACSVSNAVFSVIQGHKRKLDIATISQGNTLFFSSLMLSWGLIADIDIESEEYRWMGSARLEIYPLMRIINLRKYNGNVSFVPAPGYESYDCSSYGKPETSVDNISEQQESCGVKRQHGYQGPKLSFRNCEWKTIEGPFVTIWLHNVPWSNKQVMAAPDAEFSDGYFDMIIVKDCPRHALVSMLANMKDGSYVRSPYVVYLKVKAFRLEPHEGGGGGIIDSDGEVIARGKHSDDRMLYGPLIDMQVDRGLATLFSPMFNI